MTENFAEREIESTIRYYSEKELLALEGQTNEKMVEKGGVLVHLI